MYTEVVRAALRRIGCDEAFDVIVGNDRGGTIFDDLEVAATAPADDFEQVMRTPHAVDLAALARSRLRRRLGGRGDSLRDGAHLTAVIVVAASGHDH